MNKKIKQMLKKHVNIVKKMYPELYIKVIEVYDNTLVSIDSLDIAKEVEYKDLIYDFIKEYDRKGYCDIFWGVDSSLTCDNLVLLEDVNRIPMNENSQEKKVVNF